PVPGGEIVYDWVRRKDGTVVDTFKAPPGWRLVRADREVLLDVDFAAATRRVDADGMGSFHGVLPARMGENFTGWSAGRATSEVKEEAGRRFLRIATQPGEAGGQFAFGGFEPKFPGCFRLRLRGRTAGGRPLTFGLRLNGAPYTSYSSHTFASADWKEETYLFAVSQTRPGSVGLYLYTGAGEVDLARLTLETATEADLAAAMARPPKSQRDYIRHARFPLGLPCGWNLGRDCLETVCSADAQEPAPDGLPVLKIASKTPWELWGEAFQTAYPAEPHTVSFRYRSAVAAHVAVIDDEGHWSGSQTLPASETWREARLVVRPRLLARSFGLRFSGAKGPFRLDQVRVCAGEGELPPPPFACSVSLAVEAGEIAADTRIQYIEEGRAEVVCRVLGAPAGSVLRAKVANLYGEERELAARPLTDDGACRLDYAVFPACPVGQFRVTAWVEREGARVSADEELVVTRLPRPVAWGRDAPDSPFGCHFNANRGVVRAMKAGGVNWVRLHDAGSQVSGWYAVEPEKGRWNFHDAEVACYRDAHVKIFAQLGTAPAWATHYGDLGCTRMGYFEKYLRPTNDVDWVNYVTAYVRHHERNIDEYFVWNEPWGRWWASAADIRWFDPAKAGADFAALSCSAYAAVKRVNPKIRVSGFNSTSGELGRRWTADVLTGGGFDCCDVIDWHYYTPHPRGLRGERNITAAPLRPIRERHPDLGGKSFYMSEGQGTSSGSSGVACRMSGLLKASVPWPAEDAATYSRIADMTSRYILSLLAEGNAKVFLYSSHAYEGLARMPSFLVLLGADGFAHPALVAHAQLARAVEGRRFVRREDAGRAGVKYVFEGRGGSVAVYSDLAKDEVLALAGRQRLKDLYGNAVRAETLIPGTVVYAE
ncbi:MAG: hypothetical protein ACI4RA_11655, partial [Kiritimatiellia bacterium]